MRGSPRRPRPWETPHRTGRNPVSTIASTGCNVPATRRPRGAEPMRSSTALAAFALWLSLGTVGTAIGGDGPCPAGEDEVSLVNCGVIPEATGSRRVRTRTRCDQELRVEVKDLARGDYTVRADGMERGSLTVRGRGSGQIAFDATPGRHALPLDFDPFGDVDILKDGVVILSLGRCPFP